MRQRPPSVTRPEFDALLGRSDPFEYFVAKSADLGIGVAASVAKRRLGVVREVLGDAWLRDLVAEEVTAGRFLFEDLEHPLAKWIRHPAKSGALRLVAFARDLESLRALASFERLRPALLDRRLFDRATTQLTLAARVADLGASEIELEPSAAGGRAADIAFDFADHRFALELYRPSWRPPGYREIWETSLRKILAETTVDVVLIFQLKDDDDWETAARVELQKAALRAAARAGASPIGEGTAEVNRARIVAYSLATLDDEERERFVAEVGRDRPHVAGAIASLVPRSALATLAQGGARAGRIHGAAFLCLRHESPEEKARKREEDVERVVRQLASKHGQTLVEGATERLLVLEYPVLEDQDDRRALLERANAQILRRYEHMTAVAVVSRTDLVALFDYAGVGRTPASERLLSALNDGELAFYGRALGWST